MAAKKYGKYVVELEFKDGPGFYRQVANVNGREYGIEFNVEYGAYRAPGYMGESPAVPHVHDYDQVLFWLGGDGNDMGELGAQIELSLGEEGEKHMITSSTAVAVPKGMPHFPANILSMERRFMYLEMSCSAECRMKKLPANRKARQAEPAMSFFAKYRDNVINLAFTRKGPWSYGPRNRDDSGGYLSFIHGKDPNFDFLIMCESLKKAPYRFGPIPDKPHVHPKPEILFFLGTDVNDLSKLGGEAEIALGKELETHVISRPTAVVIPGGFPHCPLTITRVDRPMILTDIRPYGSEAPSLKKP